MDKEKPEPTKDERILILYDWMRGMIKNPSDKISSETPNLSDDKAFSILYVLQEFLHIIPDKFEKCSRCGCIFNIEAEGTHVGDYEMEQSGGFQKWDEGKFYCDSCTDRVVYYKDRKKLKGSERLHSINCPRMLKDQENINLFPKLNHDAKRGKDEV